MNRLVLHEYTVPEDVWVALYLDLADVVVFDGVEFKKQDLKCMDDIYSRLYGMTRFEWNNTLKK